MTRNPPKSPANAAQLQRSQKLESVGKLAAGVAHDFNNILTVIKGHVGLLRGEPGLRAEAAESLQQVSRATERAAKLIDQLLHFTRETAPRLEVLDLNEVLTSQSALLQRALGEDVTVQLSYAPALPQIEADRSLIEQALLDLVGNARQAMPCGGQLVISTAQALIDPVYVETHSEARPGCFVCLSVIDTGCGLSPEILARISQPDAPADGSTGESHPALATVCAIARRHHGWVEAQSRPGQGSTFRIFLPAVRPGTLNQKPAGLPLPRGTETILVVEDEPPVLWITRSILEQHGYHVLEAASGVEALAVWHQRQKEIALLLVDVVMPVGVTGQELAEQFQQQKPDLKVLFFSGYSAAAAIRNLELVPGLNFLQKPFDGEKLTRTVRGCLDRDL